MGHKNTRGANPSSPKLNSIFNGEVGTPEGWNGSLSFINDRHQIIRYGHAPSITGEVRGTIVLTHGYAENIDLFHEAISFYQGQGFDVYAMDWQGFGLSERDTKGSPIPASGNLSRHADDLDKFVTEIVRPHAIDGPVIASTHSMGGHFNMLAIEANPKLFDGAIFSAPMLDIYRFGTHDWSRPIIQGVFNLASAIGFKDVPTPELPSLRNIWNSVTEFFTGVKEVVKDPMNPREAWYNATRAQMKDAYVERPTFGWIAGAFDSIIPAMEEDKLRSIQIPVLIGSAGHEDLVDNYAHERAAHIIPNAKLIKLPGAGHSLWHQNEPEFGQWTGAISNYLDTTTASWQLSHTHQDLTRSAATENAALAKGPATLAPAVPVI